MSDLRALLDAIRLSRHELVEAAVERVYGRNPPAWERYGARGRELSARDCGFHLDFLVEALELGDPSLFVRYGQWAHVLFSHLGLPPDTMEATLDCLASVLRETFGREASPALELIAAAVAHLAEAQPERTHLTEDNPLREAARSYLEMLIAGDRRGAHRLIQGLVESGIPIKDIYLSIFQPVQREVGRLWQTNALSVAQEHFCTATTQLIMASLYPRIVTGTHPRGVAVVACVAGELHELGARMVADLLEMDGWDACYLGANAPAEATVRLARERRARLLAVSATLPLHLSTVRDLVAQVRSEGNHLKVMVGGWPFNASPSLWRTMGADAWAPDAAGAAEVARPFGRAA